MQTIEAPDSARPLFPVTVFLAGGISKCANWQEKTLYILQHHPISVYNPRREKFVPRKTIAKAQIQWEYPRLRASRIVAFWFAPETVNPITLFELGSALYRRDCQKLVVAMHENYVRRLDIIEQCRLANQHTFVGFDNFLTQLNQTIKTEL